MGYFEEFFKISSTETKGEVKVLCPFHSDTNPSATVNLEKRLFHCWVCPDDVSGNEAQFMARIENIPEEEAYRKLAQTNSSDRDNWKINVGINLWTNLPMLEKTKELGISNTVLEDLDIGVIENKGVEFLAIPVFQHNSLMDVRAYNIYKHPNTAKVYGRAEAGSGWVIPFNQWVETQETTYIMEGERDMLVARSLGLNAITLTGGASAVPNAHVLEYFKGREIIIVYDNDDAGRDGAHKLGTVLKHNKAKVKVLDMSQFVHEKGEDFADYIDKYQGDVASIMFARLDEVIETGEELEETSLGKALGDNVFRKTLRARVTVTGELSDAFIVPTIFTVVKEQAGDSDTMAVGEEKSWVLEDTKMSQILPLIEVDAKDRNVIDTLTRYTGVPIREKGIKRYRKGNQSVYKAFISDQEFDSANTTIEAYSFTRMDVGKNYIVDYQLHPHPNKNQKIVALVHRVEAIDDTSNFELDEKMMGWYNFDGTVEERLNYLYESAKHYVAAHMDYDIWLMTDLVFHSILEFDYGGYLRGALDVFILGDTQVGKSETTTKLIDLYNFGHHLSLKTSTTVGLIGGSNKQANDTYVNTIGAIPRQHKKLIVLEEFSGASSDFITKMTDIRSSNKIRIARASGELIADCMVRMITISNPVNDANGKPRFLSSFPDGTVPIMELIKSAEDTTRYDAFLLAPKKPGRFNPFDYKLEGIKIPREVYQHKIQWVETRQYDDVVFGPGVDSYVWEKAEKLNEQFESNVPIFGTTTSKKLARFCVAMASLLYEVNDEGKILVTKEIVDYTAKWLHKIYSSKYFRLDDVREEWLSYTSYKPYELESLQELYGRNAVLIDTLSSTSVSTQGNLQSISGLTRDQFSGVFSKLVRMKAVQLSGNSVYPTEKFRLMYTDMDKTVEHLEKHTDLNKKIKL